MEATTSAVLTLPFGSIVASMTTVPAIRLRWASGGYTGRTCFTFVGGRMVPPTLTAPAPALLEVSGAGRPLTWLYAGSRTHLPEKSGVCACADRRPQSTAASIMAIDIRVIMLSPFGPRLPAGPAARPIMTGAPDLSRRGAQARRTAVSCVTTVCRVRYPRQ